jgi:Zn-dependent peptidase ImmA (M78 family)/transcriptional regulator with XRE-family HTH domain
MRSGTPGFQASRLIEARESRGLTQLALAEELTMRTSSSISRWESGTQSPEPKALEALARALKLPVSFFLNPQPNHGEAPIFFRSMASTTQALRRKMNARLRWGQDIALSLQEWVDLPAIDVPVLDVADYRDIRDADIEKMANECRIRWSLGFGPISDVLLVLENAGICVIKEEIGSASMDGLSNWSTVDERAYILIAKDKDACVRSRMDAAHELGHLVLHRGLKTDSLGETGSFKEIERQAFYFAGAFLLPAESFSSEIWSPSLNEFVARKARWQTSIGAMIMRCRSLNMIDEEYQRRLWKHYSVRGWKKNEPLDNELTPESPRLLQRSVRLLIDERVRTRRDLLEEFRLSATDVEALCGLPHGFMTNIEAEVIQLPKLKEKLGDCTVKESSSGNIVPFERRR